MPEAQRRLRAGDVLLAAGCLVFLGGLISNGAFSSASTDHRPETSSEKAAIPPSSAPDSPSSKPTPKALPAPPQGKSWGDIPPEGGSWSLNSRSIHAWKDLPIQLVHLPHWLAGVEHKKLPHGTSMNPQLSDLEFQLKMLGFDEESVRRGLEMVRGIDRALMENSPEVDATQRLLSIARGGGPAEALAESLQADGGAEAVRVRAIALLAQTGNQDAVAAEVRDIATSDPSREVRASAGVSLLWMGRPDHAASWVATESSPEAVYAFFVSSRTSQSVLDPDRPPNVLVFRSVPMVEAAPLVDVLMKGTVGSDWPPMTRAGMYGAVAWFGSERKDVSDWMMNQYLRATTDVMRSAILFHGPRLVHSEALETKSIEIVRTAEPGLLTRTALTCLGRFETERSFQTLTEVIPRIDGRLAEHAIPAIGSFSRRKRQEVRAFLLRTAESHPDEKVRKESQAVFNWHYK